MTSTTRAATLAAFVALSATAAFALPNATELILAKGGPIKITPIYHASLQIEYHGKVFQIDPFSAGNLTGAKKADIILITHTHPDHMDRKAINLLLKPETFIVGPPAVVKALAHVVGSHRLDGLTGTNPIIFGERGSSFFVRVNAFPSYNLVRGPKPGEKYHPKGEFNGYVLTMGEDIRGGIIGEKRIYIAGDTEATPEMKGLKNIDIAFIPMNLPYTMTPQEAADGVRAFKPKIVYPYHYRFPFDKPNDNPYQFQRALAGSGIQVRIRGWYAHPAGN